ncbi:MAG: hypothetical protein H6581_00030 [Bacteroidia bacterium]|nr:hypothetical protein [Bacteroidia bacterium]
MRKFGFIICFSILLLGKSIFAQQLSIPEKYLNSWTNACELTFLYSNLENPKDTVELSMVFRDQNSQDFFWSCNVDGFVPFDNFYHWIDNEGNISSHLGYHKHDVLLNGEVGKTFSGARLEGKWYEVTIQNIQEIGNRRVVIHDYELNNQIYEIHYVPGLGITQIVSSSGSYKLERINGEQFIIDDTLDILAQPKNRISRKR